MLIHLSDTEARAVMDVLDKSTFNPNIELSRRNKTARKVMRRIKQRVMYEDSLKGKQKEST